MSLGPITRTMPLYRDVYHPTFGDVRTVRGTQEQTLERYQCETCGQIHEVLGLAMERFYCQGPTCDALVGIQPATVSS